MDAQEEEASITDFLRTRRLFRIRDLFRAIKPLYAQRESIQQQFSNNNNNTNGSGSGSGSSSSNDERMNDVMNPTAAAAAAAAMIPS